MKRFFGTFGWRGMCRGANSGALSGLIDGELAPEAEAKVRGHLAACRRCRKDYEELLFAQSAVNHLALLDDDFAPSHSNQTIQTGELRGGEKRKYTVSKHTVPKRAALIAACANQLRDLLMISVPVPAPLLAILVIGVAALALLQSRAALPAATGLQATSSAETTQTRLATSPLVIEKPVTVERTIERIVTRTRYVERPAKLRPPQAANQFPSAATARARANSMSLQRERGRAEASVAVTALPRDSMTNALKGFEPTSDVKITLIKERKR